MNIQLTPNYSVGNYRQPYIIAELGSNHNGDMELAKKLIKAAKAAGADCVKFQSWSKDTIFSRKTYDENYFVADDYRDRSDHTLESIVEAYAISDQQLLDMKAFADEMGIDCTSTPFSNSEVDFLVDKMDSPFIKVASMDLNNYPFLKYIAQKQKPIVLSTGLSELHEIDRAVKTIESTGNRQIVLLHCVATYPLPDEDVNLRNIHTLMNIYPDYPIGFSDHTLGVSIPLAAAALGACLIEKHFTIDQDMEGWDHKISATPEQMIEISTESRRINTALGTKRIVVTESEERISSFRRSIIARKNLPIGHVITKNDIDLKRPGTGIEPGMVNFVVGRKLKHEIKEDYPINYDDLE